MKRRDFGFTSACSLAAVAAGLGFPRKARAALTSTDADRLKGELMPLGGERAGNADGSIPAWTGENLPLPPGDGPWGLMPDFFASDAKIVSINSANLAQHQSRISDGIAAMMQKNSNFRVDVYPTHRVAIATQEIYDNAYKNVTRAVPDPGGTRLGFSGAFGAIPFPIPDANDPEEAGAQIMSNHIMRWEWKYFTRNNCAYTMINGQLTQSAAWKAYQCKPYYFSDGSPETYDNVLEKFRVEFTAPGNLAGQIIMQWVSSDPIKVPQRIWEYLVGEGRIRKAPELQYDSPQGSDDDIINYDENDVFFGSLDEYDWKNLGKKEMYVPYNCNKLYLSPPEQALLPEAVNPDLVRWELHRVWVVEATLHPGKRNVLARRRFYVDEDNWHAVMSESYDANGNIWHVSTMFLENRPDIPSTWFNMNVSYNLQSNQYCTTQGSFNVAPQNGPLILTPIPSAKFDAQSIASNAQY